MKTPANRRPGETSALRLIPVAACKELPGNPQRLTGRQMEALKASIARDGFISPIVVRPEGDGFLVIGGNHRLQAARELGLAEVPAQVVELPEARVKPVAVNLNTIHGEPDRDALEAFIEDAPDLDGLFLEGDLAGLLDDSGAESEDDQDEDLPDRACTCPLCGAEHEEPTWKR